MTYRLTRKAEEDFINIYVEGAQSFGIAQAESYHEELVRTFEILADNPHMARERVELSPASIRVHPHGSHIIIYRIEESRQILIIRIRHAREDWINDPHR